MVSQVYFLGIGGIGMSALARFYTHSGLFVAGYDRTPSPITAALEEEGIKIHYVDNPEAIPDSILNHQASTLVIHTPAIPPNHIEMNFLKQKGYTIIKRSQALGEIAKSKICLAIAGTHGKTTTSTLLAHIFTESGIGCTAFLGGISKNYRTNLLLSNSPYLVAEADEYDRSFLQLFPSMAVITAIDADHLDIYGDYQTVEKAFSDFTTQICPKGSLVIKEGIQIPSLISNDFVTYRYALEQKCDFWASHLLHHSDGTCCFTLHLLDEVVPDCHLSIPGRINVENAVAASAISYLNGISLNRIAEALHSFEGVHRRFDIQVNQPNTLYIDDYAHHPAEIKATLESIRAIYPNRKITLLFQPHLYSRTRDFSDSFAESLSLSDELILLPIYPAREEPIKGVSSDALIQKVKLEHKYLVQKENVIEFLHTLSLDLLLTMGAGDIDKLVPQIKTFLIERL